MTKNDLITMSLSNAKDWKQKGQPIWVVRCLCNAIVNQLSIALMNGVSRESTLKLLVEDGFADNLAWYCEELTAVKAGIEGKKIPGSAIGGNYLVLVMHHFARLLGQRTEEETLLSVATCSDSMTISTKLWQQYAAGLQAIADGKQFTPKKPAKLTGQEPYWIPYIDLEASISRGAEIENAERVVDDAFRNRNSDASITDDQYEIEGSGSLPIRWDYRKDCILSYR